MADRIKFEEMLELLVNENKEAARELFHDIVVEKSRDIYESLLNEEADENDDELDENADDLDENDDELDENDDELDEGFDLDEFEVEADSAMMSDDPTDDMIGDLGADNNDDYNDEESEGEVEDRVEDLEDALEELKAEFEKMMGDDDDEFGSEEPEDDDSNNEFGSDMDGGVDDDEENEENEEYHFESDDDDEDDEVKETKTSKKSAAEQMREYVEKVGGDKYDSYGKMGDNGANTKSTVAGKNDMGGTTQNILRTDTEDSGEVGTGRKVKGSALNDQSPKDIKTGNVNVPGGKAGGKHMKTQNGGGLDKNSVLKKDSTDKSAGSTLNKVSTRAK